MNAFSDPEFWGDWKGWLLAFAIGTPIAFAIAGVLHLIIVVWLGLE